MSRRIAPKKLRLKIARRRFQDPKRCAPIFFDAREKMSLSYFVELAEAIARKYPIGDLGKRGAMKQTPSQKKREKQGSKILCNEILRTLLSKELSLEAPDRVLFERARIALQRAFERSYEPYGEIENVRLLPEEEKALLAIGRMQFRRLRRALEKLAYDAHDVLRGALCKKSFLCRK